MYALIKGQISVKTAVLGGNEEILTALITKVDLLFQSHVLNNSLACLSTPHAKQSN